MTLTFDFTEKDWHRIKDNWAQWWNGKLDRPLVTIESSCSEMGRIYTHIERHLTKYGLNTPIERMLDEIEESLINMRWLGDAFPRWWPNFGAGVLAAFLGSPVEEVNDTTWFNPAIDFDLTIDELTLDENNSWYRRVIETTSLAVKRWGNQVCIGIPDLGGNLDILASLRSSQSLLTDLYDQPDKVGNLSRQITKIWLKVFDQLYEISSSSDMGTAGWGPLWMPGPGYMLQSDFCYMISPAMFKQFVSPDLVACCKRMPYAFYHLDGKGQIRHLDHLLQIEHLRGIQWIPGDGAPPPEEWIDLLGRIRQAGKLCQVYVTPRGAQKIIRELGGAGFVFALWEDDESGHRDLTLAEADAALEMLEKEWS